MDDAAISSRLLDETQILSLLLKKCRGIWSSKSAEYKERIKAVEEWTITSGCLMSYFNSLEFKCMLNAYE